MRSRRHDVVVIGAGTAGLVAAVRLAEAGADVCVVARGLGSTHLAPGTIDVLGYAPERVDSPLSGIAALGPDHPYALVGPVIGEAADWFTATAARGTLPGYHYVGSLERNLLLPTAVGALKPSALVPETFAAGDSRQLGRLAVVGTPLLRDFHASLCAENLRVGGVDATAVSVRIEADRADASTLGLARRFDDAGWRAAFCARLTPLIGLADHIGLPAMLGLSDPHAVLTDLEARLGRRVFEIPTLPPSVPGMRLFELLRQALLSAGGRLALGAGVVSHRRDGEHVLSVETDTAGSNTAYEADAFVLASGGFHSGAITLDSHWQAHEQVLGLPMRGIPSEGEPRFLPAYFDRQPLARAGVLVDLDLRAAGTDNVVVAGASLAGAVSWREASGEGIALASGYRAAQVIGAELGARAAA
ncbi:MAG: anaerobic glycerol-3-phosphate dehydrogenase subunit B [Acidobacteriota bacterium]|nr:anaerobic glycerol-3-phosphate dehydrogenase subunit B [Acidobacteriota bacterium]